MVLQIRFKDGMMKVNDRAINQLINGMFLDKKCL